MWLWVMSALLEALSGMFPPSQSRVQPTWEPPAEYQQGDREAKVHKAPHWRIGSLCDALSMQYGLPQTSPGTGCARYDGDSAQIVIPNQPIGWTTPQAVQRHEMGHIYGWPGNHPE